MCWYLQVGALALAREPKLLSLLHLLEGPANVQHIGMAAEVLLEDIAEAAGSEIQDEVDCLRSATRARMRELALRKRQATLAAMGMQQVMCRECAINAKVCSCFDFYASLWSQLGSGHPAIWKSICSLSSSSHSSLFDNKCITSHHHPVVICRIFALIFPKHDGRSQSLQGKWRTPFCSDYANVFHTYVAGPL